MDCTKGETSNENSTRNDEALNKIVQDCLRKEERSGMERFSGIRYQLIMSDNFNEYLKDLGIGLIVRKAFLTLKPTFEIEVKGELYKMTFRTPFSVNNVVFKLNEEFDFKTPDGRTVRVTILKDGDDKLVELQKHGGNRVAKITRHFTQEFAKMTYNTEVTTATRLYKAVE